MRKIKLTRLILLAALTAVLFLAGCSSSSAANDAEGVTSLDKDMSNTLIVYYSYSGTTKRAAEHLQELTGGTLYELTLAEPYSGDSYAVSDRVFEERGKGEMPELSGELPDISQYDLILVGTPVWNSSAANPIFSYLQQTDFGGKDTALFWTYITNQGSVKKDFAKNVNNGNVKDGIALQSANGMTNEELDEKLTSWLGSLAE